LHFRSEVLFNYSFSLRKPKKGEAGESESDPAGTGLRPVRINSQGKPADSAGGRGFFFVKGQKLSNRETPPADYFSGLPQPAQFHQEPQTR
jgi:hypothetical protein